MDVLFNKLNTQQYAIRFVMLRLFQSFKRNLCPGVNKTSTLYNVGSRKGQILHTRLRLGCSSLNYDLYRRNITDSPLCACKQVESVSHFLLYCPQYNGQRHMFLHNLPCAPIVNNVLYGDETLSFEQNKRHILCVHSLILSTNRF